MNWNHLNEEESLDQLIAESKDHPVVVFKHSTRCSISAAALDRLERKWDQNEMSGTKPYFLDLIRYRDLSNRVAEKFQVPHQSPQIMVIREGKIVHDASHFSISYEEVNDVVTRDTA